MNTPIVQEDNSGKQSVGFRGPSPDVGRATQIKPGEVRNPEGNNQFTPISQALKARLNPETAGAMAQELETLALKAKKGSVRLGAINAIADRTEGKPTQSMRIEASIDGKTAELLAQLAEKLVTK